MSSDVQQSQMSLSQERIVALISQALNHQASEKEIDVVQEQLGRYPRGIVAVGARCVCGNPLAVLTRPMLPQGIPFPTTCYLTSPEAVKAISRLEADGVMNQMNEMLQQSDQLQEAYLRAHKTYLAFRHELAVRLNDDETLIDGISAGGMPQRVKCLHAICAQTLVMGSGVNPIGDQALSAVSDQFSPDVCRCSRPWSTEGQ